MPILCNREALAALPAGSFGRAYYDFVEREGISADGLVEASRVQQKFPAPGIDEQTFRERIRDMHDLWHVLTGYGRDPLGETCVVAFSYAQTRSLGFALIAVLGALKIGQLLRGAPVRPAVLEAYRNGRAASWLVGEDMEALLAEPLDALRVRLGIARPQRYREITAAIASGLIGPIPTAQ